MPDSFPPSPVPPWHRPTVSPVTDTLVADGNISINTATTYLNQTADKNLSDPTEAYEAVLADGNYKQQRKMIQIPASAIESTALWRVTGNFVGFVSLKFNSLGHSAELIWDGEGWHFNGGNAEKEDQ